MKLWLSDRLYYLGVWCLNASHRLVGRDKPMQKLKFRSRK